MPGSPRVAVVTDSTASLPVSLPDGLGEGHGLTVVPLQVVLGGRSLAEGTGVTSGQVADALRAGRSVTTSRPSPLAFAETYRALAAAGATSIVSIHLSGEVSGTVDAARTAARDVSDCATVEVVDSRSLGLGLGFAVLAVVRAVRAGASARQAADAGARCALATGVWLYVDTLEYLRRGGRIGAASAMLGSALSVKPLLCLVDGRLEPLERVRTASRALARLEEIVVDAAGARRVDVGVQHLAAPERAEQLAVRLRARVAGLSELYIEEVGAVVGAHAGPGMLGVVLAPAD